MSDNVERDTYNLDTGTIAVGEASFCTCFYCSSSRIVRHNALHKQDAVHPCRPHWQCAISFLSFHSAGTDYSQLYKVCWSINLVEGYVEVDTAQFCHLSADSVQKHISVRQLRGRSRMQAMSIYLRTQMKDVDPTPSIPSSGSLAPATTPRMHPFPCGSKVDRECLQYPLLLVKMDRVESTSTARHRV